MKMMWSVLAVMLLASASGCVQLGPGPGGIRGSGIVRTEDRKVEPFTAIAVSGAYEVEIACQKPQKLQIEGDDNLLPHVVTEVRGRTLHVHNDRSISPVKPLKIRVWAEAIDEITASGANSISLSDAVNEELILTLSGAVNMRAAGNADELVATISGTVNLDAKGLTAQTADVTISGVGNAEVYASRKLAAKISGAGTIVYYGDPSDVSRTVSGIGSITRGEV